MFRTVPLSMIRSLALYTEKYIEVMLTSCTSKLSANLYVLLCVQCKTLMMDRETVRNMQSFIPKINLRNQYIYFFLYFADRASQYIYLNINQLDALNFIMSLFSASTCFEHKCLSSGGQNYTIQPLVSSHLQVAS